MPKFAIRQAALRDLDVLVRHRRNMWESLGERDREALDAGDLVYRRWLRQRLRTGSVVGFIAEDSQGRVAASGCVWLQPVQPRPGRSRAVVPYLHSVYTEPAHRRSGLATRITRRALVWCKENGHTRMTLHAAPLGRGVYRSLGFSRTWEMRVRIGPRTRPRTGGSSRGTSRLSRR